MIERLHSLSLSLPPSLSLSLSLSPPPSLSPLHSIAANPKCSSADLERFSILLQQLIKSCGYDVNSSDDDETPLLLIRLVNHVVILGGSLSTKSCSHFPKIKPTGADLISSL